MHKWGHSQYLSPAYRRGYVEVMTALDTAQEEEIAQVPKDVLDFIREHRDPNYTYEPEPGNEILDMSWEGFQVIDMLCRYFWCTEEEREAYDQDTINIKRKHQLDKLSVIRNKVDNYITDCEKKGTPFQGMEPRKLKEYSKGCTQVISILDGIPCQYVQRIPKEYIWIIKMSARSQYQYCFEVEECEGVLREKEKMAEETVEILADIEYRYWKGYEVLPEEIKIELYNIPYEGEENC